MTDSLIEKHVAAVKALKAAHEQARDYIRADHLWLYELIASPRMRVQRQAHWRLA